MNSSVPGPHVNFYGGRVLLPRQELSRPPPQVTKRTRATKACTSCRVRKIKCTGELPRCFECASGDLACVYEQGRRDRFKQLSEHKRLLVVLVKDLRQSVSFDQRKKIEDTLDMVDEEYPQLPLSTPLEVVDQQPGPHESGNENFDSSSFYIQIDSPNTPDPSHTRQEMHVPPAQSDATAQWLSNIHNNLGLPAEETHSVLRASSEADDGLITESCPDSSFYLCNHSVEVDDEIDIYHLPPFEPAIGLLQQYLKQIHEWLPIISQDFENQVLIHYTKSQVVTAEWLAILNLVFAIGTRHRFLSNDPRHLGENQQQEEVLYMSRAIRLLRPRTVDLLIASSDVPLVQAFGLLSLYQLTAGHVEKAWGTIGLAIRLGISLGMHQKSKETLAWPARAEGFSQIWWSLLSLQSLLCSITGRPSTISHQDYNTPFPRFPEERRERPSGMLTHLNFKISVIAQWAMSSLYSVKAATLPWPSIHEKVIKMKAELEKMLPEIADQEWMILQFNWMDTMALITRPYLERRKDDTESSSLEVHNMAVECVQAAHGITCLLPDEPSELIFQNGPWWCLSLYIMRAMVILLLATSHTSPNLANDNASLVLAVKKLITWLRWMRQKDPVADRGLAAVLKILHRAQYHENFADVFEQEAAEAYGGYPLAVSDSCEVVSSATHPQLQPEFEEFDGSDFMGNILAQSILPTPPVYGSTFAADETMGLVGMHESSSNTPGTRLTGSPCCTKLRQYSGLFLGG